MKNNAQHDDGYPVFYLDIRRADNAGDELETIEAEEVTATDLQMVADALGLVAHARCNVLANFFQSMAYYVNERKPEAEDVAAARR